MDDRYVATIYQKIYLNENILIFKRTGIISNFIMNKEDELNEVTFYDQNRRRITLEYMECPYMFVSDDAYCYGHPMLIKDLKQLYPNIEEETDLFQKYFEKISHIICLGIYNEEEDSVKIITTNEEILKKSEEDKLFTDFNISYNSNEEKMITIKSNDFKKILSLIKKEDLNTLKEELKKVTKDINQKEDLEETKEQTSKEQLENILIELNSLTGLENIKLEVYKLMKYLNFRLKVKNELNLETPNLHMFFSGNPGTGKTTVARIIAKILYNMGYIKKNTIAEITPKDLIAGYVGQTAIKTADIIEKNRGGVIFIDEAYILAGNAQHYAGEALVEILKELEKNETIFIFAGYKNEMETLMNMNPGLTSRIGYYLEYQDFTKEELYHIFESKINKIGLKIDNSLKEKINKNLEIASSNPNFGNGRYIDKLVNKIILEHAIRTDKINTKEELLTLNKEDFNEEIENTLVFKSKRKKIGF